MEADTTTWTWIELWIRTLSTDEVWVETLGKNGSNAQNLMVLLSSDPAFCLDNLGSS